MDLDAWTAWVTLIGAVVGAITGSVSLWMQLRGKRDHFVVGLGSIRPEICRETLMHVVSRSDHQIQIADYGFIDMNHKLSSIPLELDEDFEDTQIIGRGEPLLEGYSSIFELGYIRRDTPIGAFARSATQTRPRLSFSTDVALWTKLAVRVRVLIKGRGYLV